ncbi:MAG: regulatory protein TetR [Acidobacteriaceae bacterium]|nr:regulatory protein TetR [Acidobacteriaceae bacterium]
MSNARRTPQQGRGERRLAQLLEAAASVMGEVGYEAATMTQIAERAKASIGTLYQYFPDKEAVAIALKVQHVNEMEARWLPVTDEAARMTVKELVDRIVDMIVDYIDKRPAFLPLLNAPEHKRDPGTRNRLREHIAAIFREKAPGLTPETSFRVANVTVQILKGMHPLCVDASPVEKEEIIREFKLLLLSYLSSRLG